VFVLKTIRADEERQPELVEFLYQGYEDWNGTPLPDGSRVECYEDVCHYFQTGPVPLTIDYLYFGGNVAEFVVTDIGTWIHGVSSRQ
jgi:hypothetical protein